METLKEIGEALKKYRVENELTLRKFCLKYDLDALTVSSIERNLEEYEKKQEIINCTMKAIEIIKNQKNLEGTIKCPLCNEKLKYRISSYNGHTMGKCSTEKCVCWIE